MKFRAPATISLSFSAIMRTILLFNLSDIDEKKSFDLAISINTFHNLEIEDLFNAISQINRVAKNKYIVVDSFRNEKERINFD